MVTYVMNIFIDEHAFVDMRSQLHFPIPAYTNVHTCKHTRAPARAPTCSVSLHTHARKHAHLHVHARTHTHPYVLILYACINARVHLHIGCVYIFVNRAFSTATATKYLAIGMEAGQSVLDSFFTTPSRSSTISATD